MATLTKEDNKLITLTDAAAERAKYLLARRKDKPALGLKIGIKTQGCSGMSYTMAYAEEIGAGDEVVEDKGVTVVIDPMALMFVVGTEVDYVDDKLEPGFRFNNPNEKSRCGCGESFSV